MSEKDTICYAGLDGNGNIVAAVVFSESRPEHCAAAVADFIARGLVIQPMQAEDIRFGFTESTEEESTFAFAKVWVKRDGKIVSSEYGDDELRDKVKGRSTKKELRLDAKRGDETLRGQKAIEIIESLGLTNWETARTLGEIEALRAQILETSNV